MSKRKSKIVEEYARMWPREMFNVVDKNKGTLLLTGSEHVKKPGVYILYRDEQPFYIGRATTELRKRLHDHANKSTDRYYNFWTHFSAFVVDKRHIPEVEGILIAAMQTANRRALRKPHLVEA